MSLIKKKIYKKMLKKVVKKIPKNRKEDGSSPLNDSLISNLNQSQMIDLKDEEEANKVIESFKAFDMDGDGFISVREFIAMLKNFATGLTHQDVDEIVKIAKLDVKGKMDYKEFVDFWRNSV